MTIGEQRIANFEVKRKDEVNYVRNIIKGCIFQKKKLPSVIKQNLLTVVAMRHITER